MGSVSVHPEPAQLIVTALSYAHQLARVLSQEILEGYEATLITTTVNLCAHTGFIYS
jgi:hypothetical protein